MSSLPWTDPLYGFTNLGLPTILYWGGSLILFILGIVLYMTSTDFSVKDILNFLPRTLVTVKKRLDRKKVLGTFLVLLGFITFTGYSERLIAESRAGTGGGGPGFPAGSYCLQTNLPNCAYVQSTNSTLCIQTNLGNCSYCITGTTNCSASYCVTGLGAQCTTAQPCSNAATVASTTTTSNVFVILLDLPLVGCVAPLSTVQCIVTFVYANTMASGGSQFRIKAVNTLAVSSTVFFDGLPQGVNNRWGGSLAWTDVTGDTHYEFDGSTSSTGTLTVRNVNFSCFEFITVVH